MQLADNEDNSIYTTRLQYLVYPKDLKLKKVDLDPIVEVGWGIGALTFNSPTLAKDVYIVLPDDCSELSDNFFDIEPNKPKYVTFKINGWTKKYDKTPEIQVFSFNQE